MGQEKRKTYPISNAIKAEATYICPRILILAWLTHIVIPLFLFYIVYHYFPEKSSSSAKTSDIETEAKDQIESKLDDVEEDVDVKVDIKTKFKVEMPQDFYDFWDFCTDLNPGKPAGNTDR